MNDIHDLCGAYAVDALDDTERATFETHLADCADCRAEVAAAREVLGALAASHPVVPPAGLEDAIVAAVVPGAHPPSGTAAGAAGGDRAPRGAAAAGETGPADDAAAPPADARVTPIDAPRVGGTATGGPGSDRVGSRVRGPGRRGPATWLVAAAAAVALFAGGILVGRQSAPAGPVADPAMDTLLAVAAAGDATYMPVDLMGSEARVVVSDEMGKVAVLATDLPTPAKGQCYQVWKVAPDGTKSSAGVFTPDSDGHVAVVLEGGPDVAGFVVTVEPPGGSKEPTGEMVGQVTA